MRLRREGPGVVRAVNCQGPFPGLDVLVEVNIFLYTR